MKFKLFKKTDQNAAEKKIVLCLPGSPEKQVIIVEERDLQWIDSFCCGAGRTGDQNETTTPFLPMRWKPLPG